MLNCQEIVVGFIERDGRILAQWRGDDSGLDGWELPGGKVAAGESHAKALAREIREEVGLEVEVGPLVSALCHTYADRRVALHAYLCAEGVRAATPSRARWVTLEEYRALRMPAANPPLLDALSWLRAHAALAP